ncbi:MAG TPA: hypothetical protein VFT09_09740, partial [Ilumatobacteraceae bacterium]|nr:hypothetical protein [Ilumatobacteraceae bacterium]
LDMLRRNVTLHAERALRVRGLTTTDEERLAEPRAWAFEVLGRLHQWIAAQPAVAAGFFRRMNDNSAVLDDATDRTTDLSHALFLLSLVPSDRLDELAAALAAEETQTRLVVEGEATAVGARGAGAPSDVACIARLLYDALRWTEATRAPEHRASAHACLAVAWFAAARGDPAHPAGAWEHAHRHAVDAVGLVTGRAACRRRILLFCGLVLELGDLPDAAIEAYTSGLALERGPTALAVGHRAAVGRLLLELPALALDGVGRWVVEAEHAEAALERAARYRERAGDRPAEDASFDEQVWQLAESRLPAPLHRHSTAVRAACEEMAVACWGDPTERMVIVRDLALAAGLHDWFSDVDPARLLVLAREWDLPISGVEWANPVLLHGRLAVEVARALYDAEIRLGTERFRRIERIVLHHTVGACDATLAEKVFALADWRSRQPEPQSTPLPSTPHAIDIAYRQMFADKADQVRRRGGILAPQTDDLVASAA